MRPGGRIVYATCSLDPAENGDVADAFESDPGFVTAGRQMEPWPFADGVVGRHPDSAHLHHRTLWPHKHGTDGFFCARWRVR